jgi:hypothetical protein
MTKIAIPDHVIGWLETMQLEAYQKGWDDATAAVVEAASAKRGASSTKAPDTSRPPVIHHVRPSEIGTGKTDGLSYPDWVVQALEFQSGIRAVQVANWVLERNPAANRQSIYTAIKRMKIARNQRVRQHGVKLYLVQPDKQEAA